MKSDLLKELNKLADNVKIDDCDERIFRRHAREYGIEGAIDTCLAFLPACREILPNGVHRCQTTSYIYKITFAEIKYIFENYETSYELETIVRKCINEHQLNLTFEKDHPPVELRYKVKTTKKRKCVEEGDLFPDVPKVKKQAKKLSAKLHFNFNINNESTSV